MLRRVFGCISTEGCPATVTRPGRDGCFNWRWQRAGREAQYELEEPLTKLDSRNEPAYSITEASRYLRLSPAIAAFLVLPRDASSPDYS